MVAAPDEQLAASEFTVRVDWRGRRLSVKCHECRTALVIELEEPGVTRLLALFAGNHRHDVREAVVADLRIVANTDDE